MSSPPPIPYTFHPASSPSVPVTIRPARFADLYPSALCYAAAFTPDPFFGDIIHPFRSQYPLDCARWYLHRLRVEYFDRTHHLIVATVPSSSSSSSSSPQPQIVGVAQWTRMGASPSSLLRAPWSETPLPDPVNALARWLLTHLIHPIAEYLWPIRSLNRDARAGTLLERSAPYTAGVWSGPRADSVSLHLLGVRPEFQGRGVGRRLVAWGLEQARREACSASAVAAEGKMPFYRACGFGADVVGNSADGWGNPMARVEDGGEGWGPRGGKVPGGEILFVDAVGVDVDVKMDGEAERERM